MASTDVNGTYLTLKCESEKDQATKTKETENKRNRMVEGHANRETEIYYTDYQVYFNTLDVTKMYT